MTVQNIKVPAADVTTTSAAGDVQSDLDALAAAGSSYSAQISKALSRRSLRKVVGGFKWVFPDYDALLALYSYTMMIPQGLAMDAQYYYSLYSTTGASKANNWFWVAVHRRSDSAYVSCFSIPNTLSTAFPEGGYVRVQSSTKTLYTECDGIIKGFDVSTLPPNRGQLTPLAQTYANTSYFQAFGAGPSGLAVVSTNSDSRNVKFLDWSNTLRGQCVLSPVVTAIGADNSNGYHTAHFKVQGRTLSESELFLVGGGRCTTTDNVAPYFAANFMRTTLDGTTKQHEVYNPFQMINLLVGTSVSNISAVECEGATTDPDGKCYSQWYYETITPYSLNMIIIEEDSVAVDAVDLTPAAVSITVGNHGDADLFIQSFNTGTMINPYTGAGMGSLNAVANMMRGAKLNRVSLYCSGSFFVDQAATYPVPSATMVQLYRTNGDTVFMQLTGPTFQRTITSTGDAQFTFNKFQVGGQDTDPWYSGNGEFVIAGFNNLGVVATRRSSTGDSIHYRFQNPNGVVGSINTNGTSTSYLTSSDVNLKNDIGVIADASATVDALVDAGAVRYAAFKADPENVQPMFMAQRLYEVAPYAVRVGSVDADTGEEIPWAVDYSKLVPVLVQAIYDLQEQLNSLKEGR